MNYDERCFCLPSWPDAPSPVLHNCHLLKKLSKLLAAASVWQTAFFYFVGVGDVSLAALLRVVSVLAAVADVSPAVLLRAGCVRALIFCSSLLNKLGFVFWIVFWYVEEVRNIHR